MQTPQQTKPHSSKFSWAVVSVAVVSCTLGWGLRHVIGPKTSISAESALAAESQVFSPAAKVGSPSSGEGPVVGQKNVVAVMKRLSAADTDDMVELIERIGVITRLTDAEVKLAWDRLSAQAPTKTFGGSVTAMY